MGLMALCRSLRWASINARVFSAYLAATSRGRAYNR